MTASALQVKTDLFLDHLISQIFSGKTMTASTDAEALQVKTALFVALTKVAMGSGIYKNIIQEMTHKAGFERPDYVPCFSESGHYKYKLKIGGISFEGEPAKTENQAEKNAAMAALSSLKPSKIPIDMSILDWSPSCSCGHGYMVLKTSRSKAKQGRQFWVCPSINGEGGCGRRIWIDEVLFEDIFHVQSDDDISQSDDDESEYDDSIDQLREEFGKLSCSIKCDVAKVHLAIDNLKEGLELSASMDAFDELKQKFGKLSSSIKRDVAQVRFALEDLEEQGRKASVSLKNLEEAISSVKRLAIIFVGLIFVMFANHIVKGK